MTEINKDLNNKKSRLGRGLGSLLGEPSVVGSGANQGVDILKTDNLNTQSNNVNIQKNQNLNVNTQMSTQNILATSSAAAAASGIQNQSIDIKTQPSVAEIPIDQKIWKLSIDKIKPSTFQPRSHFDKEKLSELAQSIKESGLLQPIVVRKSGIGFEIIAGERRWRAAQMAGMHEIPALVKNFDDKKTLELAIIENIQREDLNPIEEAEGYQRLIEEFHLTQQQVSEKVGKERATITNCLRLLSLPTKVRDLLVAGKISSGHAKVLLGVDDTSKMLKLAEQVEAQGLSVRKLEKIINDLKNNVEEKVEMLDQKTALREKLIKELVEKLQKKIGTRVQIESTNDGKGKIQIAFYSDEQLNSIIDRIL